MYQGFSVPIKSTPHNLCGNRSLHEASVCQTLCWALYINLGQPERWRFILSWWNWYLAKLKTSPSFRLLLSELEFQLNPVSSQVRYVWQFCSWELRSGEDKSLINWVHLSMAIFLSIPPTETLYWATQLLRVSRKVESKTYGFSCTGLQSLYSFQILMLQSFLVSSIAAITNYLKT